MGSEASPTEDRSGPQPMVHTTRKGLVIGGSVTFAISWSVAVFYSTIFSGAEGCYDCGRLSRVLWIPVAGPMLADDAGNHTAAHIAFGAWTLTQAAGLTMLAWGLVGHDVPAAEAGPVQVHLVPTVGRNRTGLVLAGNF
jgi:hypothetical protein